MIDMTPRQRAAVSAYFEQGSVKRAAFLLGISPRQCYRLLSEAKQRTRTDTLAQLCVVVLRPAA